MEQIQVNGITLEHEVRGAGDPVVFIHGGLFESFGPMAGDPSLKDFRLIRYCRRGYGRSSPPDGQMPISKHAADCLALLKALDATPAHVVGHSSGGTIAIQLALDAPEVVRSLALLEPAGLDVPSAAQFFAELAGSIEAYQAGDKAGAVDNFMQGVCGEAYRAVMEKTLPGAMEQAVGDADAFFGGEFPAVGAWSFTRDQAARITQPVLAVLGGQSHTKWPAIVETHQLVLEWLPQAKPFILPGANHMLQCQNPHDMAEGLAAFLAAN